MKAGTATTLAVFLAAAVFVALPARAADTADAEAAVKTREEAFARTMAVRDLDAFSRFISEEAVFFNGNAPLRGRDTIVAAWSAFFQGAEPPFSWAPDVVTVLDSGDLALSSGPVFLPDGSQSGRFNSIWRRESDGVWRVVFDKGS